MKEIDHEAVGERVREARKRKGLTQTQLADELGKSLRTIQKYENGEIAISIAMINDLARKLDTTSTYLLGNKSADVQLDSVSDVIGFLFQMEKGTGLHFNIEVKRPPHHDNWQCSLVFDGKEKTADNNADICLFLEDWQEYREDFQNGRLGQEKYAKWQDETLAYYAAVPINNTESEETPENK